ncbi:MAG: hypothetical protein KAI43_03255 [Candidatus Aureabacteria bacterium]|nr:hypothetical protein [Candidatus Auribacterota bacterium]
MIRDKKLFFLLCFFVFLSTTCLHADEIDMSRVKKLSKMPVTIILDKVPVKEVKNDNYWKLVKNSKKPVIVMFYTNNDQNSQNLATLIRYIALEYSSKLHFYCFKVTDKGKPHPPLMKKMEKLYSLDKVPGVLFYDNDTGKIMLEKEQYTIPTFKEYKTPGMMIWKIFYKKVKKIIEENILD